MILEERIIEGLFSEEMFESIETLVTLEYLSYSEVKYFLKLLLERIKDKEPQPKHEIVKQRVFILLELVTNLTD